MPLTINTNIASIQSERALAMNRGNMETAMQRLSSGKRINSALDDASGLAVANRMRNQIEGLNMAIRNANDGISLAQTAEGSMEELQNILLRMRELAVQASNGTYTDEDRSYIAAEFDELMKEMRRVSNQAAWDGDVKLIAEGAKPQQVQVGINAADYIQVPLQSLTVEDLNLSDKIELQNKAGAAIETFKFHNLSSTSEPAVTFVPASWTSGTDSLEDLTDVRFIDKPLPNFELRLWNGARDSDGNPEGLDGANVNVLNVTGAGSVQDLIKQLKAHPNYDSTTCDIKFANGEVQVIWKIAGQPDPASKLEITNPADGGPKVSILKGDNFVDYGKALVEGAAGDLTNYPKHYQQRFDLSDLAFHRDTIPKSAGNFFSVQIGNRVLTADNAVDASDLAAKLKGDSDYNFIRDQVGLGDSKLELFEVIDIPAGAKTNANGAPLAIRLNYAEIGDICKQNENDGVLYLQKGATTNTIAGNVSGNAITQTSTTTVGEVYTSGAVYKIKGAAPEKLAGNISGRSVDQAAATATVGEIYKDGSTYKIASVAGGAAGDTAAAPLNDALVSNSANSTLTTRLAAEGGARFQKLVINFGEDSTDRAFMYQSHHNVAITDIESAITALDFVDAAAKVVNESRARMGATMSRIEYTINNLMNLVENTEEAKSRVLDTDYAKESAELAKAQILAQAGTAMLAQANQSQQYVLNLLRQG
jgi:flagellin